MANVSVNCISNDLKFILNDRLKLTAEVSSSTKEFLEHINGLSTCDGSSHTHQSDNSDFKPSIKVKRPKSKYNLFVSDCMKRIGKSVPASERMKSCSVEWNSKKK